MSELITKYVDITFDGENKQMVTGVYQYDHGLSLRVHGIPTNAAWQFQFGHRGGTDSVTVIGATESGAVVGVIPDELLMQKREIVCYLYYESEEFGLTVYVIYIPVDQRMQPATGSYTPQQIDAYDQLVATLQGMIDSMPDIATVAETKTFLGIA